MNQTKLCRRCGETKPIAAFSIDRSTKDGLYRLCRSCRMTFRTEDPEKAAARTKAYRAANREKIAAYQKAYEIARRKASRATNPTGRLP
jgi:hypothetical protein